MRCSRYFNGDRMHVILNGKPLEEFDCFKYLGLQVAADGGCERDVVHRMNEGYRAWGVLKSVLSNRGFGIKAMKCLYEGVIIPTALYGAEAWGMRSAERRKVNFLFIIIKKGRQCKGESYTPYQSEDPSPTMPTYRQKEMEK